MAAAGGELVDEASVPFRACREVEGDELLY